MHQSTVLYNTAKCFNSSPQSFPLASKAAFANKYSYNLPNKNYQKLFQRKATISSFQHYQDSSLYSTEQLTDSISIYKPVFITYLVLLVIQLLRKTLTNNALPNNLQDCLVYAAQLLAKNSVVELLLVQKPSTSFLTQYNKQLAYSI